MRAALEKFVEAGRMISGKVASDPSVHGVCGCFVLKSPAGGTMKVFAEIKDGWEHLAVSRSDRSPYWKETEWAMRLWFNPEEFAVEYHFPVNVERITDNVRHLWRCQKARMVTPLDEG